MTSPPIVEAEPVAEPVDAPEAQPDERQQDLPGYCLAASARARGCRRTAGRVRRIPPAELGRFSRHLSGRGRRPVESRPTLELLRQSTRGLVAGSCHVLFPCRASSRRSAYRRRLASPSAVFLRTTEAQRTSVEAAQRSLLPLASLFRRVDRQNATQTRTRAAFHGRRD